MLDKGSLSAVAAIKEKSVLSWIVSEKLRSYVRRRNNAEERLLFLCGLADAVPSICSSIPYHGFGEIVDSLSVQNIRFLHYLLIQLFKIDKPWEYSWVKYNDDDGNAALMFFVALSINM